MIFLFVIVYCSFDFYPESQVCNNYTCLMFRVLYSQCWPVLVPQSCGTKRSFFVPVIEKKSVRQTPSRLGCSSTNVVKSSLS